MAGLPPSVRMAADAVNGTLSRRDLVALGFAASTVDAWAATALTERVARGEYRIAGSSRPLIQQLSWMLWRAGPGARLAGALVCGLRGLDGFSLDERQHIAVPPGRRVRGVGYPVVRTPIPAEDHGEFHGLPAVTVERALIGAAATHPAARVRSAYYKAVQLGLTTREALSERAEALGRVHGAPQMRAILRTGALRVESPKEWDLLRIFRPSDPAPEAQVWVEWRGRWYRLDFAFLDARLALEYDGRVHEQRRDKDADRDLALMELGIQTIRVTASMLRDGGGLRRRILAVHRQRLGLGLPALVPSAPPWL